MDNSKARGLTPAGEEVLEHLINELKLKDSVIELMASKIVEYIRDYEGCEVPLEEIQDQFFRKAAEEKMFEDNMQHIPRID